MRKRMAALSLIIVLGFNGCATTGPGVTGREEAAARRTLEAKRLRHQFRQNARLVRVGYRILQNLPPEEYPEKIPFVGVIIRNNNKEIQSALSVHSKEGVVIVGIFTRKAGVESGLETGDLVRKIGVTSIRNEKDFKRTVKKALPGRMLKCQVERRGFIFDANLEVEMAAREISFKLNDRKKEVNAFATLFGIEFTLPMMNFLRNDDELAVIMGHEIAHVVKGHIGKSVGSSSVAGLVGGLVAIPFNLLLPGLGGVVSFFVTSGVQAQFSQEFEREADYFGQLFAHRAGYDIRSGFTVWERFSVELPKRMSWGFLNTHPSTAERVLRSKKVADEIASMEKTRVTDVIKRS